MKRFWLSWEETSQDYRPLTDPPNRAVLAWWCSGEAGDSSHRALVALVEETTLDLAKAAVMESWPCPGAAPVWRFCSQVSFDWRPGDRFPISKGWSQERIEARR